MSENAMTRDAGLGAMVRFDLRLVRSMARLAGFFLFLGCFSLAMGRSETVPPMLTMLPVMALLTVLSRTEKALTPLFGALPLQRATVMRSHYLMGMGMALLTYLPWLVGVVVHAIQPGRGVAAGNLCGWSAAVGVTLVSLSVMVPAMVKWGTGRGLQLMLMVTLGLGVLVGLASSATGGYRAQRVAPELTSPWLMLSTLVVGLATYAVSYVVSTRIYERQDH